MKSQNNEKQILITGGLGFIGHHLVKKLIREGYFPIIIDNLSNGSLSNLKKISKDKYFFIKADIQDYKKIQKKLLPFNPNTIVHLAAIHFIPYCNDHEDEVMKVNVDGTNNLLKLSKDLNIQKFIFTSSASVYGLSEKAHKETDQRRPADIYGRSKSIGENQVIKYSKNNKKCNYNIFRLFNVYGPNDLTPHFIPEMIKKIRKQKEILVGNINTKRDYVYVDDVVEAYVKIIKSTKNKKTNIYNVGTGTSIDGRQVIDLLAKNLNRSISIKQDKSLLRNVDVNNLQADITKLSKTYNWQPKNNINQGIKKICQKKN